MKSSFIIRSLVSNVLNSLFFVMAVVFSLTITFASIAKAQIIPAIQSTPINLSTIKSSQLKTDKKMPPGHGLTQMGASNMNVTLGKSTLLKLPAAINRISVGSPNIADVRMINPREVYVLGKLIGMTNITLWTKDGQSRVIDVTVLMDASALQNQLLEIMPREQDIKVIAAGDSLVLSGLVSNTIMVDRAVALADAFIRTSVLNMMVNLQGGGKQGDAGGGQSGQQGMQVLRQGIEADDESPGAGAGLGSFKVINLLQVRDNQQVMLEVKVVEVNRTEAEKLGFDFAGAMRKTGSAWTQLMTGVIGGGAANILLGKNLSADVDLGLPRVSNATSGEHGAFLIDAEKRDEVIKILAEPTIVAISGQEASFLVGGEILIPVSSGVGGSIRLQPKQFGVGLTFTPTVLEEGRINLNVNPEVSELVSFEQVASTGLGAIVAVPTFRTRRISTTVQLRDGQSLAIGGLLQDNFKEQIKRFPILGEIPVLGALFSSSNFLMDKTELMIIVTPRLVKPLQPDYSLPTDAFVRPGRGEFLLQGRMESSTDDSETTEADAQTIGKEPNYPAGAVEPSGFQMK
tara:strand:- start:1040 stop:2758 length:1719 start_codon:yes stop_codon:yes gene_type:complete